jgi:hypothetical protein
MIARCDNLVIFRANYWLQGDEMTSGSAPVGGIVGPGRALILQTPNPLDLSVEDLEGLVADLEKAMAASGINNVPVKAMGNEPLGVGNQLIDHLFLFLPDAEFIKQTAFTTVIAAATVFMRGRFKRKHESGRPRQIAVYDPDGKLLKIFRLTSEDAQLEQFEPDED